MGTEILRHIDTGLLELGIAEWAMDGESGDAFVVEAFPGGALVAVIDGLGHGHHAAVAARAAVEVLQAHASEPLEPLLNACHEALRTTRGAVISLASVRPGVMSWVGVGNVQGALLVGRRGKPDKLLAGRGGIVGHGRLPGARVATVQIARGDTLVFTTDGVRSESISVLDRDATPQANAERILAAGSSRRDDALVVVARYRGEVTA